MAETFNIRKAKSDLSRLVKLAEGGEDVLIARNGVPVARLTCIQKPKHVLPWGALQGSMSDDFDAPLEEFKDYL